MKSNHRLRIVSTLLLSVLLFAPVLTGDEQENNEAATALSKKSLRRLERHIEKLGFDWRNAKDESAKSAIREILETKVSDLLDHELAVSQFALKELQGKVHAIEEEIESLKTNRKAHIARLLEQILVPGDNEEQDTEKDAAAQSDIETSKFISFKHGEIERRYLIHLPRKLPDNAPLVFLLHGYRADARDYVELGMNQVADTHGFAVCYPQGEKDREGIPHWNARFNISKVDDIGFLSALAVHLQAKHELAPDKTFTCGISNGGFMSYTLVAEKPDVFKAAASVIGTMSGYTWEHRDQIKPVPILQISGLSDEIVPYDGSMSPAGGWGGAPAQDEIIDFWTKLNKTKSEEVVKISDHTTAHSYKHGVSGNEVWHYKIKNFGHGIPRKNQTGINAVEVIWKFFNQF